MIITDIRHIDRIAEEIIGTSKSIISIDMDDYAFIKRQSSSLNAIKFEISEISENSLVKLDKTLEKVCKGNACNLLMYICSNGNNPIVRPITMEQMELFHDSIEKHVSEESNIIWGIGECDLKCDSITILLIIGFCNR